MDRAGDPASSAWPSLLAARPGASAPVARKPCRDHQHRLFPRTGARRDARTSSVSPYDETHALGICIAQTPKLCRSARSPSGSRRCRRHCCPSGLERRAACARTGLPLRVGLRRSNGPLQLVELPSAKRHHCPGGLARVHASLRPRRPEARSSFRCKRINDVGRCRYRVGGVA